MEKRTEERLCPKCGKKMTLVAAGYYCVKDDYVIDPITGKPPVKPECVAWVVEDKKQANIFFDGNRMKIGELAKNNLLHDISVETIEEIKIGQIRPAALADAGSVHLVTGLSSVATSGLGKIPTLKIACLTERGVKTDIILATDKAADIAHKIDSLRASLQLTAATRQGETFDIEAVKRVHPYEAVKEKEIIREKEVIVKIRCSYCYNLYDETLDKCPHCGAHR